jgi:hypothetical protein
MSRFELGIDNDEHDAALAIADVAECIERLCGDLKSEGIPEETVKALHRAYRTLKPTTLYYFGDERPLFWDAPSGKFEKAKAKKC